MNNQDYLKKYYKGNIEEALKKLEEGIPVQYIVGNVNFYGLELSVNENVLIPRFETEELVSKTINYLDKDNLKILDIGTGSGCIAITLSKKTNNFITAVDISKEALEVARSNALQNGVDVEFYESDIFSNVDGKFDVIISNPPYIDESDEVMDLVYNNEPHLALFAPNNGLYFYEEILKNAKNYLNDDYLIAFEIGYTQGEAIKSLAIKYLNPSFISIEDDIQGKNRFVFIKK